MTDPIIGRPVPITPSGPTLLDPLDRLLGNTGNSGPRQAITLRDWLNADNRQPGHRGRQAAMSLIDAQADAIASLRLEIERKDAALRQIADRPGCGFDDWGNPCDEGAHCADIARTALSNPSQEGETK